LQQPVQLPGPQAVLPVQVPVALQVWVALHTAQVPPPLPHAPLEPVPVPGVLQAPVESQQPVQFAAPQAEVFW